MFKWKSKEQSCIIIKNNSEFVQITRNNILLNLEILCRDLTPTLNDQQSDCINAKFFTEYLGHHISTCQSFS